MHQQRQGDQPTSSSMMSCPDSSLLSRWSPMSVRIHIDSQNIIDNNHHSSLLFNTTTTTDQLLAVARCDSRSESLPDDATCYRNTSSPLSAADDDMDTTTTTTSSMVRQQSDTTHLNRRLQRSIAINDDVTSGANHHRCLSPILLRPTRHVYVVDQHQQSTSDSAGYIQLNQYRLMQEIGQGSYGIVKLAYNEQDKSLYALKVLDKVKLMKKFACFRRPPPRKNKPLSMTIRDPLQQVHREIAILKKLCHPNVVKLVEVLDDPSDTYLYMVFEFVEKGSILDIPTDEPLSEDTSWGYFRDIVQGLEYLHYQKIVHRDLKPSNILLSNTGQVKIADFGVSSEFEGLDAFLSGTAGSPAYLAPEALIEDSSYFYSGRAQDIWSLGITLYSFVIGRVPFWDTYSIALHKKIKNDPVVFPEKRILTSSMKSLILGMLTKDPGHRMMLHEIKIHAWVTRSGTRPLPSEEENCHLVTVTDEEIKNCVRIIPRLDTLILVKAMGHRKRFGNPFRNTPKASSLRIRPKLTRPPSTTLLFADRSSIISNYQPPPYSPTSTTHRLPSDIENLRISEFNGQQDVPESSSSLSSQMVLKIRSPMQLQSSSSPCIGKRMRSESPSTDRIVTENGAQ